MKSTREPLGPTRVKLTVEVPAEELQPSIDQAYKTIGEQIQVPGFRRGKVPARIIDQRVGRGAVLQEAINDSLPGFYGKALDEHEVKPLGQPEVDITAVPLEADQDLTFTAEVDCRPEIELPDFTQLSVTVDPVQVTDEDIEERLTSLRERFGSLTPVERAAQHGDFVTIDLSAEINGEQVDSVTGISYEVGSGTLLEGVDEALTGMSGGETTSFTTTLAGGEHAGESADCTVTLQAVKVRELPELDDDFAQLASEFDSLEELRADLTAQVEKVKQVEQVIQARDKLIEELLERLDIPVPDGVVEHEVQHHLEEEGRQEDEEHRSEIQEQTREALRHQFLLDTVAEQQDVEVSQGDLIEYLVSSAQQYGIDPQQFAQVVGEQGQIPQMVAEVGRRKAMTAVLEMATVVDTEGTPVDVAAVTSPTAEEAEATDDDVAASDAAEAPAATEPVDEPVAGPDETEPEPGSDAAQEAPPAQQG